MSGKRREVKIETKDVRSSERYICLRLMGHSGSEWYLMDLEKLKRKKNSNSSSSSSSIKESILTPFLSLPIFDPSACCASAGKGFYFLGGYDPTPKVVIDLSDRQLECLEIETWLSIISPPEYTIRRNKLKPNCAGRINQLEQEQKGSDRALKFDANKPDQGFMNIPPLPHPRSHTKSLAFKGKIYVFGGCDPKSEHFGECFDPDSDTWSWTTIFSPANSNGFFSQCGIGCVAVPYDENQLLLGPFHPGEGQGFFWLYNVESKGWTPCLNTSSHISFFTQHTPVKVGSTFYFKQRGSGRLNNYYGDICALDFDSGLFYRGNVKSVILDSNEVIRGSFSPSLFHLGGENFCFFTIHATKSEPYTSGIHFNQVRVVKKCGGYLDITWVSKLYIPVAGNWQQIIEITPVDEIFVETLLPYIEKANIGNWVFGIGVLGVLLSGVASISSSITMIGNK